MPRAAIAFGSNLGDRVGKIIDALKALRELDIQVTRLSRLYESAPAYVTDQPAFLNGAALVDTTLDAHHLLKTVKQIEANLGRTAGGQRWGPRPIDLDIIFYEDQVVHDGEHLIIPHPRWQERGFVKGPLADLAPSTSTSFASTPLLPMTTNTTTASVTTAAHHTKQHVGLDNRLNLAAQLWSADGGEPSLGTPDLYCVMPMGRLGLWPWQYRSHTMGVLNVTPDSFSDGGKFHGHTAAIQRAKDMIVEGADIIDIGGQSTRPGADNISVQEECERVLPVIKALAEDPETCSIPISVDTFYSEVARKAVEAGATMVNDVSGGDLDTEMVPTVAALGVPFVCMHMRGDPKTMQSEENTRYSGDDVCEGVARELTATAERALEGGIEPWRLILDPGIGFAKTADGNFQLIGQLQRLRNMLPPPLRNLPLLVGPSRKGFLGQVTGKVAEERDAATVAAAALCVGGGANILRVHNVGSVRDGLRVADAVSRYARLG